MSTLAHQQQYQQVLADLREVQQEDIAVSAQRVTDDPKAQQIYYTQYWLALYVRYVRLAKRLVTLHDTELQPQRRQDMRTVLDSCLGRMLEARHNIVEHCGDYVSLDDTLEEMKLSPAELDPPLPTYILEDRREALLKDRTYALSLQQHYQETEPNVAPVAMAAARFPTLFVRDPTKALPPLASKASEEATGDNVAGATADGLVSSAESTAGGDPAMPLKEAVRILQLAERGRQARQRAAIQLQLYRKQQYAAAYGAELKSLTGKERAATIVQKVALGYLQQKRARARYQQERELLGMASTAAVRSDVEKVAADLRRQDRKARQQVNQAELMQKTLEMEEQLRHQEGPKTLEKMMDEVLMHMAQAQLEGRAQGGVVEVPTAEEGGSLAMLGRSVAASGGSANSNNSGIDEGARPNSRKSTIGAGRKPSAGAVPSVNAVATAGGGGSDSSDAPAPTVPPSAFLDVMTASTERYNALWREKFQISAVEQNELDQPYDEALLRQELLAGPRGVMQDLRECVDQLVMMEVNNLKERLEAERNTNKKGGRKAKKEKKPKKPKLRDTTKGENLESMLNTTIYENKLQLPPPEITLSSFLGPIGVAAGPLDRALRNPGVDEELKRKWTRVLRGWTPEVEKSLGMSQKKLEELFNAYNAQASWLRDPSAGEVRAAAAEYGVLPLGSQVVHDLAPHPSGVLLYGASGSGKTLLSFAIANESGARFFNLSAGNFLTTKGIPKMVQVVFYTARLSGPSIIYFDNIEKIFPGKGLKGGKKNKSDAEAARGKKLKKEILKGITSLQPTDRVLLIATTTEPWAVDMTTLRKYFQRALHLAPPDYATRAALLTAFVNERLQAGHLPLLSDTTAPTTGAIVEALGHIAVLTDGFSAQQLKACVTQTLSARRLERLTQRPLDPEEFVPAIATTTGLTAADRQKFRDFQATLPVVMRRANPAEDFQQAEDDAGGQRKAAAAPKKKK